MKDFTKLQNTLIDKWYFGDIELSDYKHFSEMLVQYYPDSEKASVLLSMSYNETARLEELSTIFANCMKEIGMPLVPLTPLGFVRARCRDAFEAVIFSATEADIHYIASLDHGRDVERYRLHLKEIIFQLGGLFTKHRYVNEVVQIGSNYVDPTHEHAFAICNCLIAQNILWDIDHSSDLTWCFEKKISECHKLPEELYGNTMCCIETAFRYQKLRQLKPDAFSGNALKY